MRFVVRCPRRRPAGPNQGRAEKNRRGVSALQTQIQNVGSRRRIERVSTAWRLCRTGDVEPQPFLAYREATLSRPGELTFPRLTAGAGPRYNLGASPWARKTLRTGRRLGFVTTFSPASFRQPKRHEPFPRTDVRELRRPRCVILIIIQAVQPRNNTRPPQIPLRGNHISFANLGRRPRPARHRMARLAVSLPLNRTF